MIFNSKILPVQNKITRTVKKTTVGRKSKSEKRRRKADRRSSVRDGVIVSLSSVANRRKGSDRRKLHVW